MVKPPSVSSELGAIFAVLFEESALLASLGNGGWLVFARRSFPFFVTRLDGGG